MHNRIVSRGLPQWVSCLLLLAFVFRALIPSGFMPAAGLPFTLQICPDGFPVQLLPGAGEHAGHAGHGAMDATAPAAGQQLQAQAHMAHAMQGPAHQAHSDQAHPGQTHAGHAQSGQVHEDHAAHHVAHPAQLDVVISDAQQGAPSHQHHTAAGEHCLFGAASSVGPASQLLVSVTSNVVDDVVVPVAAAPMHRSRPHRLAQPRAPPAFS